MGILDSVNLFAYAFWICISGLSGLCYLNFEFLGHHLSSLVVATLCPVHVWVTSPYPSAPPFASSMCHGGCTSTQPNRAKFTQPIAVALTTSEFQHPTQISLGLGFPTSLQFFKAFQHCHSPKVFEHRCHRCRHGVAGCWRPPAWEASSG